MLPKEQELDLNFPRPDIAKLLKEYEEVYKTYGMDSPEFAQVWHSYSDQIVDFYGNIGKRFITLDQAGLTNGRTVTLGDEEITVTLNVEDSLIEDDTEVKKIKILRKTHIGDEANAGEEEFSVSQEGKKIEDLMFPPKLTVKQKGNPPQEYSVVFRSAQTTVYGQQGPLRITSLTNDLTGERINTSSLCSHPPEITSNPQLL